MKKKTSSNVDIGQTMLQIQAQLAALDKKLEAFINKSLTDLAEALAAQKAAAAPRPVQAPPVQNRPPEHRRPMFAIVCYQCGKDCEIPFKPVPGRPVYCPECFAQKKAGHLQPKVNVEVKPAVVEAKAPEQPVIQTKPKKKVSAPKKSVVKKTKKKSSKK